MLDLAPTDQPTADRREQARTLILLACLLGAGAAGADIVLLLVGAWPLTFWNLAEPAGFALATAAAVLLIRRGFGRPNTIRSHA